MGGGACGLTLATSRSVGSVLFAVLFGTSCISVTKHAGGSLDFIPRGEVAACDLRVL